MSIHTTHYPSFHKRYEEYKSYAYQVLSVLPESRADIRKRVSCISLLTLRRTFAYLIYTQDLEIECGDQLSPLFKILGCEGITAELQYLIETAPQHLQREQALAALFHDTIGQEYFESLSEYQRIALSGPWIRPMMRLAHQDQFPRFALAALYHSTADYAKAELLNYFEECRQIVNADPLDTYDILWQRPLDEQVAYQLFQSLWIQDCLPEHLVVMQSYVHPSLWGCLKMLYRSMKVS